MLLIRLDSVRGRGKPRMFGLPLVNSLIVADAEAVAVGRL
jgi:hypothetical protein